MSARSATAWAPASIGNVGVGFDVLGLAVAGVGDRVRAERTDSPGVDIVEVTGDKIAADANQLATEADNNTAGIAARFVWDSAGVGGGLRLWLHKGTPLGSGMGSSAASAVAGAMAANALLPEPRPHAAVLDAAMAGEAFASKARHADNVAPSLFGGLILCPAATLPECWPLPVPPDLCSVLVHPHLRIDTAASRATLSSDVHLATAVEQMGLLASFVHACHTSDQVLLARTLRDVLVEPQRRAMVTGFDAVKAAAISAGALGCSLSGSGPSLFAIGPMATGAATAAAMVEAFANHGIKSDAWVSPLHAPGASVEVDG